MSLAALARECDDKLTNEFARAFGDDVARELEESGDDALASDLRRILHENDALAAVRVAERAYGALTRTKSWPKPSWRECYVLAQLRTCVASLVEASEGSGEGRRAAARNAARALDMTLIVGAPADALSPFVAAVAIAHDVEAVRERYARSDRESGWLFPKSAPTLDGEHRWLEHVDGRALEAKTFKREYYSAERPVVLKGLGATWPAMNKWDDLRWWRDFHGHRSVPLEIGKYDDVANWREEVKTMADFVDEDMLPSVSGREGADVAYLAQHQLVEQLADLAHDFTPPEFCSKSLERINVWMGTAGTVTPCHFDTYDNLLGQVAGYKFVRLYLESDTPWMYRTSSSGRHSQGNFSAVDVEHPDLDRFPDFINATPFDVLLAPGDFVFIPAKCWHYVRSLTPSVSLNFWF